MGRHGAGAAAAHRGRRNEGCCPAGSLVPLLVVQLLVPPAEILRAQRIRLAMALAMALAAALD